MSIMRFLQDDKGNASSMRVLVAFIVIVTMTVWAWVSIKTNTIAPMSWEQMATVIGALMAKTWQKKVEK